LGGGQCYDCADEIRKRDKPIFTGEGEAIPIPTPDETTLGNKDWTIEFIVPVAEYVAKDAQFSYNIGELSPADGEWHSVALCRQGKTLRTYGDEYIDEVLFCFSKVYVDDKLTEAHYTRADLVKG